MHIVAGKTGETKRADILLRIIEALRLRTNYKQGQRMYYKHVDKVVKRKEKPPKTHVFGG